MFIIDELEIRNLEKEDKENVIAFINFISEVDGLEALVTEEEFDYVVNKPEMKRNSFVGYHKGQLLAFGSCFITVPKAGEGHLQVYVHPEYRHCGIGSQIYDVTMEQAKKANAKRLMAGARKSVPGSVDFLKNKEFQIFEYMWKMERFFEEQSDESVDLQDYTYRKITENDLDDYVKLMNDGFRKDEKEPYTLETMKEVFINKNRLIYFLERDNEVIATASINIFEKLSIGYITSVAVYTQYRGRGIGHMLLTLCLNEIKEKGLSKATLDVVGTNDHALKLYKRVGFRETDTTIRFEKYLT